jgi:hypothetical protein
MIEVGGGWAAAVPDFVMVCPFFLFASKPRILRCCVQARCMVEFQLQEKEKRIGKDRTHPSSPFRSIFTIFIEFLCYI